MKRLLWLDDYRNPLNGDWLVFSPIGRDVEVSWVKNYQEFVSWVHLNGLPDGVCFDHDLGEEKTGYDVAKWLVEYCLNYNLNLSKWSIQSSNPVGRENIECLFKSFEKYEKDNVQ